MRPISVTAGPVPVTTGIANAQAAAINTPLNLNGAAVTAGVATLNPASQVTISSANGADAGQFYISGMDAYGPHGETVTMAAGTGTSVAKFAAVSRITPLFTPAGNITAAASVTPFASSPIRLDEWANAQLGIQVAVSGTANFTIQHSFDEGPDSLVNPIPAASMIWESSLIPSGGVNGTASVSFGLPVAPLWMRILLNSGSGSVRMNLVQYNVVDA